MWGVGGTLVTGRAVLSGLGQNQGRAWCQHGLLLEKDGEG